MKFYLNGKRISRAKAREIAGDRFNEWVASAIETLREDPQQQNDFMVTGGDMLTIYF